MNLSIRDLRAIIALAEEKNFTRAAERCHLSQSAFSTLIKTIEDGLGAKLFGRTTRSVELTPEGRLFEPSARRTLADLDEMVSDFRDVATRSTSRHSEGHSAASAARITRVITPDAAGGARSAAHRRCDAR